MITTTLLLATATLVAQAAPPSSPAAVNAPKPGAAQHEALKVQVMLDRAGFSPGALDGRIGAQSKRALAEYEKAGHDAAAAVEPLAKYTVTEADAAGPYAPAIPPDLIEQAKLEALAYTSILEALAERFHATPALLQRLNPGAKFAAGDEITVPNVEAMVMPGAAAKEKEPAGAKPDVTITVSKAASALTVTGPDGKVMMYAPVTTGSERDPLPLGEWKVNGVQMNPTFRYNPDLFWDADPTHTKALIPAGPNNPVGLVWVDLSKEHYGIHGTPNPATIGRSESHGCVRLTNWDALRLAGLVKPGTRVVFKP